MLITTPHQDEEASLSPKTELAPQRSATVKPSLTTQVAMAGTAAVITVTVVHPIDVVKTLIQFDHTSRSGMWRTGAAVWTHHGPAGLWTGMTAAWLREAGYTSLRLGLYEPIKVFYGCQRHDDKYYSTLLRKFAAGSTAGAVGVLAGNPFGLLKMRLITAHLAATTTTAPPTLQHLAVQIWQQQGWKGFYRGLDSNIARAMVLNGTKMAVYDTCKIYVQQHVSWFANHDHTHHNNNTAHQNDWRVQGLSAIGAGFFMTCTVAPLDMVRTRLMTQSHYKNALDCLLQIIRQEGVTTLWKGFGPIWLRFAPTATLQLVLFEQMRQAMGMKSL